MSYEVVIERRAEKDLMKLDKQVVPRIYAAISGLADNPRPSGSRKLAGEENSWRIRVGDYRVVYEIEDKVRIVTVFRIAHRKDVYDG